MNLHDEDLNLLIVFEAMLETRSVSKASTRLGMSQPSMSHMLAKMRKSFDDPMFIRVKNDMQPTPRALAMASAVKQVLALARCEIFQRQDFNPAGATQTFTLCMTDVAETSYLPQIINAVRKQAPQTRLRTVSPIAEKLEEGLESGAVDLAIGYFPDLRNAGVFQQRLVRSSGFVCIAGADNPHIGPEGMTPAAFARAPHVAVRTEGRSQEVIEQAMIRLGIARQVVVTVPHFLGLMSIIPQTDLISMIALDLAPAFERQEGIRIYPLPFPTPQVEVIQIWHKRYHKDSANQWLRGLVRQVMRQV
ncbi:MAG: LysR family transcriptional regulator [Rhodoferax sp.]|nr:LysR family transcriptional regulator [Rhodoferax sp.]